MTKPSSTPHPKWSDQPHRDRRRVHDVQHRARVGAPGRYLGRPGPVRCSLHRASSV